MNTSNHLLYFEIQATDIPRAIAFYHAIFGWEFTRDESITHIEYYRIEGSGLMGGLLQRDPTIEPATRGTTNAFMCSIRVNDFDTTAETILNHGGKVVIPKILIPGKCEQGYFLDPEKNVFGIFFPYQEI